MSFEKKILKMARLATDLLGFIVLYNLIDEK